MKTIILFFFLIVPTIFQLVYPYQQKNEFENNSFFTNKNFSSFRDTNSWFPLGEGNRWQFFHANVHGLGLDSYVYKYGTTEGDVYGSEIIGNNKYYYIYNFAGFATNIPIRYDSASLRIYVYLNNVDNLFMDFNLSNGDTLLQIQPDKTILKVVVSEGYQVVMGDTVYVKGYVKNTYLRTDSVFF